MEEETKYRKEQCTSGMYPHCQFCSHTCADRYNDFLEKGINMQFIPTDGKTPFATFLHFYKEDGKWYADVKSHTKEENQMVCGTEALLEAFAEGKNSVMLVISTAPVLENGKIDVELTIDDHDKDGAWYKVSGELYDKWAAKNPVVKEVGNYVWICNVTHTVLGEHPDKLYISLAKKIVNVVE